MKTRWWRTADEMAADFARRFPARSDREFLIECGMSNDPLAERAALAVRKSVAKFGAITSDHIYAMHSYPGELESLSNWDSLDFIGWIMELEQELGIQIDADWFKGLPRQFYVRDLAGIVSNEFMLRKH